MKHKDSMPYKIILRLAEGAMSGKRGGNVTELTKDFSDYAPYDEVGRPWTEAARDVACHFGASRLPIDVYYGFSTIEIRVFKPEFD